MLKVSCIIYRLYFFSFLHFYVIIIIHLFFLPLDFFGESYSFSLSLQCFLFRIHCVQRKSQFLRCIFSTFSFTFFHSITYLSILESRPYRHPLIIRLNKMNFEVDILTRVVTLTFIYSFLFFFHKKMYGNSNTIAYIE